MNKFEESSILERKLFKKLSIQQNYINIKYSDPAKYEKWDCLYLNNNQYELCEIKVRNYTHDRFDDWILEKNKYDSLLNLINNDKIIHLNCRPVYINFFIDGMVSKWYLDSLDTIKWIKESHNSNSQYQSNKIEKLITKLKIDERYLFNIKDNNFIF